RTGYGADIAALRRGFPDFGWHSYADWAKWFDWSVLDKAAG
ncbi:NmrA/HSCARG family protein, partial [Rhizobium ruizarguesonis]